MREGMDLNGPVSPSCEAPSSDPQSCSVTIEYWIPNKELQNARWFSLSGLVPGGRPPVKLHQVTLNHTRPFVCTIDDCRSTYRRRDHLNHHLLQHQGKLFKCPIENCKSEFAFQGNVKRHIVEFHSEDRPSTSVEGQKEHVCQEHVFQFASKLRKHEGSHEFQSSPACCGKTFSYKHVRDKHEESGCHVYAYGDFEEADEQFRSRLRGGCKRMCPTVEMLVHERVTPPDQFGPEAEFLSKFFPQE
ncbi:hypothetical protein ACLB2K_007308 [Fragaria x ananassa]